jgi:hypothetical protein
LFLQEWTLLVNGQSLGSTLAEGGETQITTGMNSDTIFSSKATTTPGCAVAFRKDLQHEGLPVKSGTKEIFSMNIWVTRRESGSQVLLVKFPETEAGSQQQKQKRQRLLEIADGTSSYALPVSEVLAHPDSMLAAHIRFSVHANAAETIKPKVLEYTCDGTSYEQFATIYKIIRGEHVTAAEMMNNTEPIKYFGLNTASMLVDLEAEMDEPTNPEGMWGDDGGEDNILYTMQLPMPGAKTVNEYVHTYSNTKDQTQVASINYTNR